MITASKLIKLIDTFDGADPTRYRHDQQDYFIFTEGVMANFKAAVAAWLLNLLAYDVLPVAQKAAKPDGFGLMRFSLHVDAEQKGATSRLTFSGCDKALMDRAIGATRFPPGNWSIYIYPAMENDTFLCEAMLPREY